MTSLKVAYINIEFDRHLDTVLSFLRKEHADIVLLNELLEPDVSVFEEALGAKCFFVPQMVHSVPRGELLLGHGVFSALPISYSVVQYAGTEGKLEYAGPDFLAQIPAQRYQLVVASIQKDDVQYDIGLTHFPWTPDGEANDFQRQAFNGFMSVMEGREMVLFGDFNAPRGKEIFSTLASRWKDNIPDVYATSLDESLHRVGPGEFRKERMHTYMVDGCFTTPSYTASNVRLEFGVSDHAAVVAEITKTAV